MKPPAQPERLNQHQEGYVDGLNGKPKQPGRGVRYGQGHAFGKADRKALNQRKQR